VGLIALNLIPISEDYYLKKYYEDYFKALNDKKKFLLRIQLVRDFDDNLKLMGRTKGFIENQNPSKIKSSLKTNCLQCHNAKGKNNSKIYYFMINVKFIFIFINVLKIFLLK
jgi:hypothetical protein